MPPYREPSGLDEHKRWLDNVKRATDRMESALADMEDGDEINEENLRELDAGVDQLHELSQRRDDLQKLISLTLEQANEVVSNHQAG